MFTTLLKRYARPCRPWKAFEMISSWSDVWHRQLLQEYIRFPFRYCLNSRFAALARNGVADPVSMGLIF